MSQLSGRVAVGHPVDVATGTLFHDFDDYYLSGQFPLLFNRHYSTALTNRSWGMFGRGWSSPFEVALRRDLEGYRMVSDDGTSGITFDDPDGVVARGGRIFNYSAYHDLREEGEYIVVTRWDPDSEDVRRYWFCKGQSDAWWPLVRIQDPETQNIDIERDQFTRVKTITQRRERRGFEVEYNSLGRVSRVNLITAESRRQILSYGYNTDGLLSEFIDAVGNRAAYEYNADRRMIRELTLGGMVFHFRFDSHGRCIETSGLDYFARTTLQIFDAARFTQVSDALGNVTTYFWNHRGQIEREVSPLGNTEVTEYDEYGRIKSVSEPGGREEKYEYDERGNCVLIADGDGVTSREFNDDHQILKEVDSRGATWQHIYTADGRTAEVINPLGHTLQYSHGSNGDLIAITDEVGNRNTFELNSTGDLIVEFDWDGNRSIYEYDPEGRNIAVTEGASHTEISYDALGREREVRYPDGAREQFGWNALDELVEYIDPHGSVHRYRYAGCGQLVEYIDPNGGRVRLEYSLIPEQVTAIYNQLGEAYRFEYDADDRVIRETDFAGRVTSYEYFQDDIPVTVIDPAGHRSEITHDANGNVTSVTHYDGTKSAFAYDGTENLLKAVNSDSTLEFEYDLLDQPVVYKQDGYSITNVYDAAGNRIERTSSLGHTTKASWTGFGLLSALEQAGLPRLEIRYGPILEEVSRSIPGRVSIWQSFDSVSRLIAQRVVARSDQVAVNRRYGYTNGFWSATDDNVWGRSQHTYDAAGRLVTSRFNGRFLEEFRYTPTDDVQWVRKSPDQSGTAERQQMHEFAAGRQITRSNRTTFAYDATGALVRRIEDRAETRFQWNSRGELAQVVSPTGEEWSYRYDALGRRVAKNGPGISIEFVWDGDVVLYEIHRRHGEEPRIVQWEFDPEGFAPLAKIEGGRRYLSINDPNGAPREFVTDGGEIAWSALLTSYGELDTPGASETDCPVRFPGQWFDAESGLHYNQFRYYDPRIQRYISSDPLGILGELNLYAYVANPLNWEDPYGLAKKGCSSKKKKKPKGRRKYVTYTKRNKKGKVYTGRSSGYGTPKQILRRRDANHHRKGFGPARLDKVSASKSAIRGREHQKIMQNRRLGRAPKQINGISPRNKKKKAYLAAATREFGPLK